MVGQLNNELSSKLEVKLTDLVNRLLTEQEERARSIDDVKYQIDMKEKLNLEKGSLKSGYAHLWPILRQ